ncbi:MAG TPA: hypothetical protein VHL11_13055 [Phototrophicaceae bacterium]|nr:hypothetical protein [Phototrophicaceae bacterium]
MAHGQLSTIGYRRPDFVSPNFIAESKNAQNLYYESRDFDQIQDFALAARALNRPLWVFTRVNTLLDPEFYEVVESTGGGVIPYFTVSGYIDPVDHTATNSLLISSGVFAVTLLLELNARRPRSVSVPTVPRTPVSPLDKAHHKMDAAEDFKNRAKDRNRLKIDVEDSRDDPGK